MKILVTGANGFIGQALCSFLQQQDHQARASLRTPNELHACVDQVIVDDITADTSWHEALEGMDAIVHLAARAHVLNETQVDPLTEFRKTNVDGTLNLAHQALLAGVKRFVFVSSIGVLGAETHAHPFSESSVPKPQADYAISKLEAELALQQLVEGSAMELVIIRPPLVYGANAPGNFGRLLKLVSANLPLPLGAIHNHRSMVSMDNLVDFIELCLTHPKAANQTFLIADGTDVSTTELIKLLANGMGKTTLLLPIPVKLIKIVASLLGKKNLAQQLCGSLQIDISKARNTLGWVPPVSTNDALILTGRQYQKTTSTS
ncbi:MAG: SDR family oxidoreductase [Methylococcaceae bacterium]|nr:SDR family oxidoreductase [Methylococcaceae bacterium]